MKQTLTVDVWSDIVCPWCAIGKKRLEAALARFSHRDDVEVVFRAFELDPSAPALHPEDNATRLARKYGRTQAEVQAMTQQITATAAKDGLDFHLEQARSGNTFDGHRVLHLAAERGLQGAVKERFMRGYMAEGLAIGERDVIVRLAVEAGLDEAEVREVLASDRYAAEVRDEEKSARNLGINGVPFFVLGGKYAVSGAQSADVLLGALEQAWASLPSRIDAAAEGAACGREGCA